MYIARFKMLNDYYNNLDNATFDEAIKFLNYNISSMGNYRKASIYNKETGQEIFSYRIIQ